MNPFHNYLNSQTPKAQITATSNKYIHELYLNSKSFTK
jgi:hypothetical protein